jgi:hypothetical protein
LKEGERAEVIVLLEGQQPSIAGKLAALKQLQNNLNLTDQQIDQWINTARNNRKHLGPQE